MNKPKIDDIFQLNIHNIGNNGEGVGVYNGFTVFVDGALTGELVEVKLTESQKRFGRAQLISILQPSPDRVKPPCPLFGKCGGCQLMHLSYPKQLEFKRQRVVDALQRIGKFDRPLVEPCIASPSDLSYRNKIQLPARQKGENVVLGLYARASHDLVEVDSCYIHCPLGEQIFQQIKKIIGNSGIVAYNPVTGEGELRHVLIKSTLKTDEALVILVTNTEDCKSTALIAKQVMATCPQVKGVIQNINANRTNVILGNVYKVLRGASNIEELMCGLKFKVSPASFFQVNPAQAESLYSKALELAQLSGQESVLDAYCGVGTLSLIFAKYVKKVIGVECVAEAIQDAKENAQLNEIENATFICEDAETYIKRAHDMDVVLLNPPRQGCDPVFLEGINRLSPKKVIYISCDPATLARDLALLSGSGYRIKTVQPFDMFPQTAHVETIVLLEKHRIDI